jgi:hypothetical protein
LKGKDYLLLRRAGALWGVANGGVTAIRRSPAGVLIETRDGVVVADEVLAVAEGLEVHRPGALLRRFARASVDGLAVHRGLCVTIVDPGRPPDALRAEGLAGDVPDDMTLRPDAPRQGRARGEPAKREREGGDGKTRG